MTRYGIAESAGSDSALTADYAQDHAWAFRAKCCADPAALLTERGRFNRLGIEKSKPADSRER